jgi:hypothetical protein
MYSDSGILMSALYVRRGEMRVGEGRRGTQKKFSYWMTLYSYIK